MLIAANRSQSLFELSGNRNFPGSLTSGQPLLRPILPHNDPNHTPECIYCKLTFPNEAGLQAHEQFCGKKKEEEKVIASFQHNFMEDFQSRFERHYPDINPHSALKRRHTHQDAILSLQSPTSAIHNIPGPSEPATKHRKENSTEMISGESSSTSDQTMSVNPFPQVLPAAWEQPAMKNPPVENEMSLRNLRKLIPVSVSFSQVMQTFNSSFQDTSILCKVYSIKTDDADDGNHPPVI